MNPFEQLEGLVSGKLAVVKMVVDLFKLEAKIAGLSLYPLLLTLSLLLVVLMSTWLVAMLLVGYCFLLFVHRPIWAVAFVLFINLSAVILLLHYLLFNLKKMSFEKTRAYFTEKEGHLDDKYKKTIDRTSDDLGTKIKVPTS